MSSIGRVDTALYRLWLPEPLSDSAHGVMPDFELVFVAVRDADGLDGTGYTYTVGRGGSAILALLRDNVPDVLHGADAEAVEANRVSVERMLHWGGRGGPTALAISALNMALWDLLGRRAGKPLWRLLGG